MVLPQHRRKRAPTARPRNRHIADRVALGIVELVALPMAAMVEGDDPEPSSDECIDPFGADPVHIEIGGKAVDEDDRVPSP